MVSEAFWVHGVLPSLNELLEARARDMYKNPKTGRPGNKDSLKRSCMQKVVLRARSAGFYAPCCGYWTYLFVEESRKRDPLNILSGSVKIIEDALVLAELMPGDGWRGVAGIQPYFHVEKEKPGILVAWHQSRPFTLTEAMELLAQERDGGPRVKYA